MGLQSCRMFCGEQKRQQIQSPNASLRRSSHSHLPSLSSARVMAVDHLQLFCYEPNPRPQFCSSTEEKQSVVPTAVLSFPLEDTDDETLRVNIAMQFIVQKMWYFHGTDYNRAGGMYSLGLPHSEQELCSLFSMDTRKSP
ncbi:hypothetical protein H920_16390 [Fukomys damarensis]|uniref:Uncharacterized protein n=1 Tax=Fukomys damarensis TaxID=885580 RepID=A0A091DHI6_FUKDA|nr:hypothetical protein H920_16390 [Fukomys damarensis]